jgi:hypothetical protein
MTWAFCALVTAITVIGSVVFGAIKHRGSKTGIALSIPLLIVALMNVAAPFRGVIDPGYMGYIFGLLRARMGLEVTFVAGSILLLCAISAYLAATRRAGRSLIVVAATCFALTIILGVPLLQDGIRNPAANRIEFGEYLAVPGLLATFILLVILVVPFALGTVWSARRSFARAA